MVNEYRSPGFRAYFIAEFEMLSARNGRLNRSDYIAKFVAVYKDHAHALETTDAQAMPERDDIDNLASHGYDLSLSRWLYLKALGRNCFVASAAGIISAVVAEGDIAPYLATTTSLGVYFALSLTNTVHLSSHRLDALVAYMKVRSTFMDNTISPRGSDSAVPSNTQQSLDDLAN